MDVFQDPEVNCCLDSSIKALDFSQIISNAILILFIISLKQTKQKCLGFFFNKFL